MSDTSKTYLSVELHAVQNFAPSNLNRDDNNSPKDCEFGGARRARISSQCIKRAIRTSQVFKDTVQVDIGTRTNWLARWLAEPLKGKGKSEGDALAIAIAFAKAYAGKMNDKDPNKTAVLLYVSAEERFEIVKQLSTQWVKVLAEIRTPAQEKEGDKKATGKKKAKDKDTVLSGIVDALIEMTKHHTSAPDIALFGRMLADKPITNLDAACQVAHALSTHAIEMEQDYFTAVDDLSKDEETGAGMINVTGFNSACFYRYARIDWDQLCDNLNQDAALARKAIDGFMRGVVEVVPSGKQNAFAAFNAPSFLLAVVRQKGPAWSLANAFEKPVHAGRDLPGLVGPSVKKLDAYWARLLHAYGEDSVKAIAAFALDDELTNAAEKFPNLLAHQRDSITVWRKAILDALPQEA